MGTTTNLGLPYPASTDYVANGYLDIQNLADAIDTLFGGSASYTPTTVNITSPNVTGNYLLIGKWLFVFVQVTGGTATANGNCKVTLPPGLTGVGRVQPLVGSITSVVNRIYLDSNSDEIVFTKDSNGAAFTAGDSLATTRMNGWVEIQ